MGRRIVYCDTCGGRIVEGAPGASATTCAECRPEEAASAASRTAAAPAPAPRRGTAKRARAAGSRGPSLGLLVGAGVGAGAAVVALAAVLLGGGGGEPEEPAPARGAAAVGEIAKPEARPEPAAARRPEPGDSRAAELARAAEELVGQARAMAAEDAPFAEKHKVRQRLADAVRAAPAGSPAAALAAEARDQYEASLAKAAAAAWSAALAASEAQADAAAAKQALERMPPALRDGEWLSKFEQKRRELDDRIAREAAAAAQAKTSPLWEKFQAAMRHVADRRFGDAVPMLEEVIGACRSAESARRQGLTNAQIAEIGREGQYALARHWAREKDAEQARGLLESAIRNGFTDIERVASERDFDGVRGDAAFAALLRQSLARRKLGVDGRALPENRVRSLELGSGEGGFVVMAVTAGSPAAQAGLRRHDVILRAAGAVLPLQGSVPELGERLAAARPGGDVALLVWRDGKRFEVAVRWP